MKKGLSAQSALKSHTFGARLMEPEPKPEILPEPGLPEPEAWPEPEPYWETAYKLWQWGWEFHIYGFATLFLLMGLYAGYFLVIQVYHGLNKKYLGASLNAMVLLFGLSRAFVMYFDPYHQGHLIDAIVFMRVMWSIGAPCLTSADSIVLMALIETARLKLAPPKLQKLKYIATIITFHFVIVLVTDCVVSEFVEAKAMLLMCQLLFVVWGTVLGVCYFVIGRQLDVKLFSHKPVKERRDKQYIYLIYTSGAANFFLCALMLYSAFGVFGVYSDMKVVDEWPWYGFQTASRVLEASACALVFTVSAKRKRVKKTVDEIEGKEMEGKEVIANPRTETQLLVRKERKLSMFSALQKASKTVRPKGTLPSVGEGELERDKNECEGDASTGSVRIEIVP